MSNSYGSYRTDHNRTMAAYDKLPMEVRNVLASSIVDWATQPVLTKLRRHKGDNRIKWMVGNIKKWDREELAKREHQRRRGIGLYKGLLPDPTYTTPKQTRGKC